VPTVPVLPNNRNSPTCIGIAPTVKTKIRKVGSPALAARSGPEALPTFVGLTGRRPG